MTEESREDEVLEESVRRLMKAGAKEPPRMDDEAKGRILETLEARFAKRADEAPPKEAAPALSQDGAGGGRGGLWLVMAAGLAAVTIYGTTVMSGGESGGPAPAAGPAERPPAQPRTFERLAGATADKVTLADGSALYLDEGARLVEEAPRRLRLVQGRVLLDVAKGAEPMRVVTPQGSVEVLGTRFSLAADGERTRAEVLRGVVKLVSGDQSTELRAGQAGLLREGSASVDEAGRLSHSLSWARDLAWAEPSRPEVAPDAGLIGRDPRWGGRWELPLRKVDVDVHLEDGVVRTTLDQTFFNPVARQLEGVYTLALPPDAAVSRLAMYVDGKLMEGGIIERQRGRNVYESIVHRRRDPALLEVLEGNVFRIRIFPVPARREKRILLSWTQTVDSLYGTSRLDVPLPPSPGPVGELDVKVRAVGEADGALESSSHPLEIRREGADLVGTLTMRDAALGEDLVLRLRGSRPPEAGTVRALGLAVEGEPDYLRLVTAPGLEGASGHEARRWVVLYDSSASRGASVAEAQRRFLDRVLREIDEGDRVRVVSFDTRQRANPEGFLRAGDAGAVEALVTFAASDASVGATDLGAALEAAKRILAEDGGSEAAYVLYLGDGIATYGELEAAKLAEILGEGATFVGATIGEKVDARALDALAEASGGDWVSMQPSEDLAWRAFDLVASLALPRVTGLEVSLLSAAGEALEGAEALPVRRILRHGETLSVLARSDAAPASLRLRGTLRGAPWEKTLKVGAVEEGARYLPRLWARREIESWLAAGQGEAKQAEIAALGMKHFLVTPETSLLVLETERMYRRFKVARPPADGWARYEAPATIEVVYEPLATGRRDALKAGDRVHRPAIAVVGRPRAWSGVGDALSGGLGHRGAGVGGGGLILNDETFAEAGSGKSPDRDASGAHRSLEPFGSTLSGKQAVVTGAFDFADQFAPVVTEAGGRSRGGGGYFYNPYGFYAQALRPLAFDRASDRRLVDLSEHVPGLMSDGYDLARQRLLATLADRAPGKIAPEAAELLAKAKAARKPTRYTYPGGETLVVAPDGRFVAERRSRGTLPERVVFDGESLWHLYPSLELGTRRLVGPTAPALYEAAAPFIVPDAEDLARWYDVRAVAGASQGVAPDGAPRVDVDVDRLVLTPPEGGAGGRVELDLDAEGRLLATRRIADVEGERVVAEVRFAYGAGELVVEAGSSEGVAGARVVVKVETLATAEVPAIDAAEVQTLVEMPLELPEKVEEGLEALDGAAKRQAQRQLLAAFAAKADDAGTLRVLGGVAPPLTRGELVLASAALAGLPDEARYAALVALPEPEGEAPEEAAPRPVKAYIDASRAYRKRVRVGPLDELAEARPGSLVGMLAGYRALLHRVHAYRVRRGDLVKRATAWGRAYGYAPFAFVIAWEYAQRHVWDDKEGALALWADLARYPDWRAVAAYNEGVALYRHARHDDAVVSFDRAVREARALGQRPQVDPLMRNAYHASAAGPQGWRLFWARWRQQVFERADPTEIIAFVEAAQTPEERRDVGRAVAAFAALEGVPVSKVGELARVLVMTQQLEAAAKLLAPLRAEGRPVSPGLTRLAAQVAQARGRKEEAARLLEALVKEEGDQPDLVAWLYQLHAETARQGGDADPALAWASRWRRVSPGDRGAYLQPATLLYGLGRAEEAWRYLSTLIELEPRVGEAYHAVAEQLEREGRIEDAEVVWARAAEVEPTNPTWLLRRARSLLALTRTEEARAALSAVATPETAWQPRFSGVVSQARALLKRIGKE